MSRAPLAQVHPLVWKYAVDDVLLARNAAGLWLALAVMVVSQVLATLFSALQTYCLEKAGQGFVRDVRNAVFAHLEAQSLSYHHERRTGDLVARVISDVDAMETSVLGNLSDLLSELVTFVVVAGDCDLVAARDRSLRDAPAGGLLLCRPSVW